jgi:hypothetical protein
MRENIRGSPLAPVQSISVRPVKMIQVAEHQLGPEVKVFDSVLGKQMALIHCEPVE